MKIEQKNIYFVGIGGIGMSALARYFNQKGHNVAGYDRSTTDLTKRLQTEGIVVSSMGEEDSIPFTHRDKKDTLVVFTPAISAENPILSYFRENGFECLKRAQVLGILSEGLKTIAVAGTHGKTTVSSMIAYILHTSGVKINAFLGGISRDFGTNLIVEEGAEIMVTEADEFDRSFLQLNPNLAVITSIDLDHLDIYKDEKDLLNTYNQFANQISADGVLFSKKKVLDQFKLKSGVDLRTYGADDAEIQYTDLKIEDGNFHFNLKVGNKELKDVKCGLAGIHNVENASVAIAVCMNLGLSADECKKAIASFQGVKRRFDVHIKRKDFVYIDDYAHHPQEIEALLKSVRQMYPNKKVTLVFQPHLYSRTRDFGDEFADVLRKADQTVLLELYPAREKPIEGIDAFWLASKIDKSSVPVYKKNQLMNYLKGEKVEVLLTVGAGDIDTLVPEIISYYE